MGKKHSDMRLTSNGYLFWGFSFFLVGDFPSSIGYFQRTIQLAKDPVISYIAMLGLSMNYLSVGEFQEAQNTLEELLGLTEHLGKWICRTSADFFLNIAITAEGNLSDGMKDAQRVQAHFFENGLKYRFALGEYLLGKIYLKMSLRERQISIPFLVKNIGFLMRNVPFASRKAEDLFNRAIEVSRKIGATALQGQVFFDLGLLYKSKGGTDKARKYILEAIELFEQCEAEVYLKQAKKALASL